MTEQTQETENLTRAMILEAVESELVKQGHLAHVHPQASKMLALPIILLQNWDAPN